MKAKLSRWAPPGFNLKTELNCFFIGLCCAVLYSFGFFIRYFAYYQELFFHYAGRREIIEGKMMPDFSTVLDNSLIGFVLLSAVALSFIFFHYASHYSGSKSIYLMRRLPSRFELHRKALTLPVIAAVLSLIFAFIVLLIYFCVYIAITPEQCLMPQQWQRLWSVLL